jgi:hypothetical protein
MKGSNSGQGENDAHNIYRAADHIAHLVAGTDTQHRIQQLPMLLE